jgi:hypothetical protein
MPALAIGVIALASSVTGFANAAPRFYHAYLTAYIFWLTVGLGSLFLVMLHHLVAARWSIVLRRLIESLTMGFPLMAILFIPILFGMHDLYQWSQADAVAANHLLQHKQPFLNATFFTIRAVLYFAIWFILSFSLYRMSVAEDSGYDERRRLRMRRLSAGGMILFAFTSTFAAFDWLMSLDALWYSTIFGAYVFAGAVVAALCVILLLFLALRRKGILTDVVRTEHYNDLGKLIFAFMIFWAYMAFSQYFLIWYGNIPEETIWFAHRWVGSWKTVSLMLVYGHFVIPFMLLLPKTWKRNYTFLAAIAVWMLVAHWIDIFWLVLPSFHHEGAHLSWMDLTLTAGLGCLFIGVFWRIFTSKPMIPVGDPKLMGSIETIS